MQGVLLILGVLSELPLLFEFLFEQKVFDVQ